MNSFNFNFNFQQISPVDINMALAQRVRNIRKRRKLTQQRLSEKAGVSLGSVKRFESTGEISLLSFTKLAIALDIEQEIRDLFTNVPYLSLEEIADERRRKAKGII